MREAYRRTKNITYKTFDRSFCGNYEYPARIFCYDNYGITR